MVQNNSSVNRTSQGFVLPTGIITSATLSWSDRIRNHSGSWRGSQQLSVHIRDSSNRLLATPWLTVPGDPVMQLGPNARSFDLRALARANEGQMIDDR